MGKMWTRRLVLWESDIFYSDQSLNLLYSEVFKLKVLKTLITDKKLKFCRVGRNIDIGGSRKDSRKFLCKN